MEVYVVSRARGTVYASFTLKYGQAYVHNNPITMHNKLFHGHSTFIINPNIFPLFERRLVNALHMIEVLVT